MQSIYSIGLIILLILSFLGYMFAARRLMNIKWEYIPIFVFSSVACIVYLGGLLGGLFLTSLIVLGIGILLLIYMAIVWKKERFFSTFTPRITLFQLFFFIGAVLFLGLIGRDRLTHYDNFSHWAIVVKVMLSTNGFPTPDASLIDFKNYPLGISSFIYFICRFAGHAQSTMLLAQSALIFASFYAMFGIIKERKRFMLFAFLGAGLSFLSYFNLTIRINNLLVDFLLPIFTLVMFSIAYTYRENWRVSSILLIPIAGLLTVTKNTGIIFAIIGFVFFMFMLLKHERLNIWKKLLVIIATITAIMVPYLGWTARMKTLFSHVENKFDLASSSLQNDAASKTAEQMNEIFWLFIRSSIDLSTRPALGILIVQVLVLATTIFVIFFIKKKWNLWKALIALNIVTLLYYSGILALYLFSMPLDEAIWLAGFERYASSIVVLLVGGLVMCATIDIERSFHYKIGEVADGRAYKSIQTKKNYQQGIWVFCSLMVILLLSEYNGINVIASNYEHTLPYKVEQVTGDRWYTDGQVDENRYLLYATDADGQVTNYYFQYISRYMLYAPNVEGIVLFYEPNMENLLSQFDYLVVVETDPDAIRLVKKHYDVDLQPGMYQISKSEAGVSLALVD